MGKQYTSNFKKRTGALSGQAPLYLLEITHEQLSVPIRVVMDNKDVVCQGNTYVAFMFRITLPDDFPDQLPRAQLSIDNVGREMTQWLDVSNGGKGSEVRVMQIMRDDPNTLEYDITLDLMNTKQTLTEITGDLGYDDILNKPGLPILYRPENTPGIFP